MFRHSPYNLFRHLHGLHHQSYLSSITNEFVNIHRIIEWFGLEGTLQLIQFQPHAMGRDPFHQPRVLRAPSNLALNPAREGAAKASLGNLGQGPNTLTVKNPSYI